MVALACAIPVAASRLSPFPVDATSPSDLWALERLLLDFVPDVAVLVVVPVPAPSLPSAPTGTRGTGPDRMCRTALS